MVIPAIPFQMWLKFRRNQQGLIGVMTLEVPVTIRPVLSTPTLFSYSRRFPPHDPSLTSPIQSASHLSVRYAQSRFIFIYEYRLFARVSVTIIITIATAVAVAEIPPKTRDFFEGRKFRRSNGGPDFCHANRARLSFRRWDIDNSEERCNLDIRIYSVENSPKNYVLSSIYVYLFYGFRGR